MYKYKYFSTHLQIFKQKVNLDNTSLCTLSLYVTRNMYFQAIIIRSQGSSVPKLFII